MAQRLTGKARSLRQRMTASECCLWQAIRDDKLGFHFRRQHPLHGYVLDFYCHEAKLCVELDGEGHARFHSVEDAERDQVLESEGIHTLRFGNGAVGGLLGETLEEIRSVCHARSLR